MNNYTVTRTFEHPPREGDTPDVLELEARDADHARAEAYARLEGKQGTYSVRKAAKVPRAR